MISPLYSKLTLPMYRLGLIKQFVRSKSWRSSKGLKVAILGANGQVGQNVAMMLKQSPRIGHIALYDITSTDGLCTELNFIDTNTDVTSHTGRKTLKDALTRSDIVVFLAGYARKAGMSRADLFDANAKIVVDLASSTVDVCPKAMVAVVTNPINSIVPLVNEIYAKRNKKNSGRNIFGVTSLDGIRANTFVAEMLSVKPENVLTPVIGGHSTSTIIPLLSQTKPSTEFSTGEAVRITKAVQEAGDEIVKAKGKGSSKLSAAYAVTKFVVSLAKGLRGQNGVVESAFVSSDVLPDVPYLATQVELGPQGVEKNLGLPKMSEYECCLLEAAIPFLKEDISLGQEYAKNELKP